MKQEHLRARLLIQVHDELNFSVPTDELERLKQVVIEEMEGACQLSVPLIADCGVGRNWLEAH
jgi:DNA polymerase-1